MIFSQGFSSDSELSLVISLKFKVHIFLGTLLDGCLEVYNNVLVKNIFV